MLPNQDFSIADPKANAAQEHGFPASAPQIQPHRTPGDGSRPVPSFLDFASVVNLISRTYPINSDEARRFSIEDSLAMRRDPIVMGCLQSRYLPTVQLPWSIVPENGEDQAQIAAAKKVEKLIQRTPRFQQMKRSLLNAIFYGKYAVQVAWEWTWIDGTRGMKVSSWKPINGDKIVNWWSGEIGALVHPLYEGKKVLTQGGWAHPFEEGERQQLVYHVHEIEDADFNEPQMSGMINGTGVRSTIFYFWYLRSQTMQFLMDYLERIGAGGLTVYYYESGNEQSKTDVTEAAQAQFKSNTILFPRNPRDKDNGPGIDRIEPSNNGADLLKTLVTDYFDREIRRYILGQDLTTTAVPAGSDTAELHSLTLSRIIAYDAENLADTLTSDFVSVIQRFSCPPEIPPLRFQFNIDKYSSAEIVKNAQTLWSMGAPIDQAQVMSVSGLNIPKPGAAVLHQVAPMSPEGMGGDTGEVEEEVPQEESER